MKIKGIVTYKLETITILILPYRSKVVKVYEKNGRHFMDVEETQSKQTRHRKFVKSNNTKILKVKAHCGKIGDLFVYETPF